MTTINTKINTKTLNTTMYKTQICRSILTGGKCTYGDVCCYAHNKEELVTRPCTFGDTCMHIQFDEDADKYINNNTGKICAFVHPGEDMDNFFNRVKGNKDIPLKKENTRPRLIKSMTPVSSVASMTSMISTNTFAVLEDDEENVSKKVKIPVIPRVLTPVPQIVGMAPIITKTQKKNAKKKARIESELVKTETKTETKTDSIVETIVENIVKTDTITKAPSDEIPKVVKNSFAGVVGSANPTPVNELVITIPRDFLEETLEHIYKSGKKNVRLIIV